MDDSKKKARINVLINSQVLKEFDENVEHTEFNRSTWIESQMRLFNKKFKRMKKEE